MKKYHKDGTTPTNGEIFVFGSNLAGVHGAGAAREALVSYGAVYGMGFGISGKSFAIPTKDYVINTLRLQDIEPHVEAFLDFARETDDGFWVTRIGCGLAGYSDHEIAPMFRGAPENCNFPEEWKQYLE